MSIEIEAELLEIEPRIWRRLKLPNDITLAELHEVLQIAFDWENSHLHGFEINGDSYSPEEMSIDATSLDTKSQKLSELVKPNDGFLYIYDFGDDWVHGIRVKVIDDQATPIATCIDGARAAPPDETGGPLVYPVFLDALRDKNHPEHADIIEYYAEFDPERFDANVINANIQAYHKIKS